MLVARPAGLMLVLVFLTAISGCAADRAQDPAAPSAPDPLPDRATWANNATACSRAFPAVFVDRAHAQSFLPAGFTAAESSQFFGQSSVPAGRAVLIVSTMRCASSEAQPAGYFEAMAGIFVAPPRIGGAAVKGEHFYELARTYDQGPIGSALANLSWSRLGDRASVSYMGEPSRGATAAISDEKGTVFTASLPAAAVEDSFTGTLHLYWWHQTPSGLGSFEYTLRPQGYLGTGSCTAREGSIVARVAQSTTCSALFMVGPTFDVTGRLEHRTGVRPDR